MVVSWLQLNKGTHPGACHPLRSRLLVTWPLASDEVGDTIKLYDQAFRPAGRVTVTAIGVPQPPGRYRPPANTSHTMPHTPLDPEPQAWYVLVLVTGAVLPASASASAAPRGPGGGTGAGAGAGAGLGFDWVAFNADKGSAGFTLRNNTIRNHRARGMLIKASDGVVIGNRIENSTLGGIIITPELAWGEGDYVTNLTVTGNSVRNVCIGLQCYGGLALGAVDPSNRLAPAPGHFNVTVTDNRFENISQMNLWVSSAYGVTLDLGLGLGLGLAATCLQAPTATPPWPPAARQSRCQTRSGTRWSRSSPRLPGSPPEPTVSRRARRGRGPRP